MEKTVDCRLAAKRLKIGEKNIRSREFSIKKEKSATTKKRKKFIYLLFIFKERTKFEHSALISWKKIPITKPAGVSN